MLSLLYCFDEKQHIFCVHFQLKRVRKTRYMSICYLYVEHYSDNYNLDLRS